MVAPEAYPGRTYPGRVSRIQSLPLAAETGAALLPVTRNFLFLEEGDVALVERKQVCCRLISH